MPDTATTGIADHETRLHVVESAILTEAGLDQHRADDAARKRSRWPLPAAAALGGLVVSIAQATSH